MSAPTVPSPDQAIARLRDYIERLGGYLPEGWTAVVVPRNPQSRTYLAHPAGQLTLVWAGCSRMVPPPLLLCLLSQLWPIQL